MNYDYAQFVEQQITLACEHQLAKRFAPAFRKAPEKTVVNSLPSSEPSTAQERPTQ